MTTPDGGAARRRETVVPDAGCRQRRFPDTGPATTGPATTPGLVVTEECLADGRRITYFEVAR